MVDGELRLCAVHKVLVCTEQVAEHESSCDAMNGGRKSCHRCFLQYNWGGGHDASVGGDIVLVSGRSKLYRDSYMVILSATTAITYLAVALVISSMSTLLTEYFSN